MANPGFRTVLTSFVTLTSLWAMTQVGLQGQVVEARLRHKETEKGSSQSGHLRHHRSDTNPASSSHHHRHHLHQPQLPASNINDSLHEKGKLRELHQSSGIKASAQRSIQTDETQVDQQGQQSDQPQNENPKLRYGVLMDAGSSSTKVKVYSYIPGTPETSFMPAVNLEFTERVKPGLGDYLDRLQDLGQYLKGMLDYTEKHVPESQHASTPVYLMATAGLRTLPVGAAKSLMGRVRMLLGNRTVNPFRFRADHVSIISGEEEAVFAWLAVNFLRGFFTTNMTRQDSVGILEMGGGSLQVAFLPDEPLYQEEFQVYVGRRRFDLYAQSYLHFGSHYLSDQVRWQLWQEAGANPAARELYSPCMLSDDSSTYQPPELNHTLKFYGSGDAEKCREVLRHILQPSEEHALRCSPRPCAIGDRYQPLVGDLPFIAFSAFLFAPKNLKAVSSADGRLNITGLQQNAAKYCDNTIREALKQTGTKAQFASNDCLMGVFIPLLLSNALGFQENTSAITVTKSINGHKIDWALGAIVQRLSMTFMDDLSKDDLESMTLKDEFDPKTRYSHGDHPMPKKKQTRLIHSRSEDYSSGSSIEKSQKEVSLIFTLYLMMCYISQNM